MFKQRLRHPAVFLTVLALAALTFVVGTESLTPLRASASHTVPVTVTITKVDNLGDEGIEDNLRGEADLYAGVEINGVLTAGNSFSSHVDNDDHVEPFWTFTNNVTIADDNNPGSIPVSIEVWEHDECDTPFCSDTGIFESDDDKGDADPGADDEVNLVVNLATGAWTGDTTGSCSEENPGDTDSAVRVCWDISTLSASGDADQDGLLDSWETRGFDADGDGTVDVDLPTFGADPNHKDMFLELDFVTGQTPDTGAIAAMQAAFAAAPINAGGTNNNPDGQPGINLWVDTGGAAGGNNLGGGNSAAGTPGCLDAAFYTFKGANFNANRRWIFRYGIVGDPANNSPCNGGRGEIGGNDFIEFNHDGGTIMHEYGHNLNLRHGGNENNNCKPNYVSVMNYDNQFGIGQAGGGTIIDYSPPRFAGGRGVAPLPTIVENNLNENTILDATDATNQFVFVNGNGQPVLSQLNQPVDWNGNGNTNETGLTVNVDIGSGACANGASNSTLTGAHDWNVIALNFRPFGDSADGAINPADEVVPTIEELLALQEALHTTDLSITKFDSPDPVMAGEQLYYDITVTNNGPNPANDVKVTDTLPAGLVYVTSTDTCTEAPAGTVTCDLGGIAANDSKSFTMKMEVPADYIADTGPVGITNSATVEDVGGNDSDPSNNTATASTIVEDSADLRITKFVSPFTTVQAGQQFEYTIFVDNLGPSVSRNVNIIDTLVARDDVTINSCAFSVSQGGGTITQFTCTTGPVVTSSLGNNVGEFSTDALDPFTPTTDGRLRASFVLTANEAMDITNTTRVTADTPDPDQANNMAAVPLTVTAVADLSITKSGAPEPVTENGTLTYTIGVRNEGPSTAVNVVVSDVLPAELVIVSVSATSPSSCNPGTPGDPSDPTRCTFSSLPKAVAAGAQRTMTIVTKVKPNVVTDQVTDQLIIHNDARVSSHTFDANNSNDLATWATTVQAQADLVLQKFEHGAPVAGTDILYEYLISNNGPSVSRDVTFRDNLPTGTSFVDAFVDVEGGTGGVPLPCTISQPINQVLCPLGDIALTDGVPVIIRVTVHIAASVPNGTLLTNDADVLLTDTPDPNTANSQDDVTVVVQTIADVMVTKTSDADVYKSSGTVTYTLAVHNNGPSDAQGVVLTDKLQIIKQDRVIVFSPLPATCVKVPGGVYDLRCNLGTIAAGATKTVKVIVIFKGSRGVVTNTADVTTTTTDLYLDNNTSTKVVLVGSLPKP
jgi:uncharacterized repeat protein (TIGR01451 family)